MVRTSRLHPRRASFDTSLYASQKWILPIMSLSFISVMLFDGFEPLDVFGPVEVLGDLENCRLGYFSLVGGLVSCRQGVRVETLPFSELPSGSILLLPGGMGTRPLSRDSVWLAHLHQFVEEATTVLSVCTGSALLAAAACLENRHATTNKASWTWATSFGHEVFWQPCARWVVDGKFWTASGVSAGIDMALAFVRERCGTQKAQAIARRMEYTANENADADPFAI